MAGQWSWEQVDAQDYSGIDAVEAWVALVDQERVMLVARSEAPESADADELAEHQANPWVVYNILTQESDGFAGLEAIDGYATLDEAKAAVDSGRHELIAAVLEEHSLNG